MNDHDINFKPRDIKLKLTYEDIIKYISILLFFGSIVFIVNNTQSMLNEVRKLFSNEIDTYALISSIFLSLAQWSPIILIWSCDFIITDRLYSDTFGISIPSLFFIFISLFLSKQEMLTPNMFLLHHFFPERLNYSELNSFEKQIKKRFDENKGYVIFCSLMTIALVFISCAALIVRQIQYFRGNKTIFNHIPKPLFFIRLIIVIFITVITILHSIFWFIGYEKISDSTVKHFDLLKKAESLDRIIKNANIDL